MKIRFKQVLVYSLIGALGAGISVACLFYLALPILEALEPSIFVHLIIHGFCFAPFGLSIGASIVTCLGLWKHLSRITLFGTLGGVIYGVTPALFGFGSYIGWLAFGLFLAGGLPNFFLKKWKIGFSFLAIPLSLSSLIVGLNNIVSPKFVIILSTILHPSVVMINVGPIGIVWATAIGYFINCLVLIIVQSYKRKTILLTP